MPPSIPTPSLFLVMSFFLWPCLLLLLLIGQSARLGGRRQAQFLALYSLVWLVGTGALAHSGRLADFSDFPPPLMQTLAAILALTAGLLFSPAGRRWLAACPLAFLVSFQAFRFPLELAMHRAYQEGVMPVQMSYSGRNFDILTGIGAALLGGALYRGWKVPRAWLWIWNGAGLALLLNIVSIAILSAPSPFRSFWTEPANIWVGYFPFCWLPLVMVVLAGLGHGAIFWKLRR